MDITSLESIEKFTSEGLYDLSSGYFGDGLKLKIKFITLTDSHTGRPWQLCYDLYKNVKDIDVICDINGIYNPLTINEGDTIYYVEKDDLNIVRNAKAASAVADAVKKIKDANKGKDKKTDTARAKDKANEKQAEKNKVFNANANANAQNKQTTTSANIINDTQGNIKYEDGKITLFPNF